MLASVFGRRLIRLQCYEGIDTNQALYEWDYARQMLQIRALSERQPGRRRRPSTSCSARSSCSTAAAGGGARRRPGRAARRRGRPGRRRVRGVPARAPVRLPDHHPRGRHDQGRAAAAGDPDLQPHPRTARRPEAALPLPLGRLSERRARARDHPRPRARGRPRRWPARSSPRSTGCATWTWPSRRASPRPSTGCARSRCSARPTWTPSTVEDTLGAVVKERDDLELVREQPARRSPPVPERARRSYAAFWSASPASCATPACRSAPGDVLTYCSGDGRRWTRPTWWTSTGPGGPRWSPGARQIPVV